MAKKKSCVVKGKEFKELLGRYDVSSDSLELAIKVWDDSDKSHSLDTHLHRWFKIGETIPYTNQAEYDKAISLYNSYSDRQITSNHVGTIVPLLLELFGEENIVLYTNLLGEAIVKIAKPALINKGLQLSKKEWARTSPNNYEVSTAGDNRFSALKARFSKGTVIDGVDVGGKTIEFVYQNVIKQSTKGKAPAKTSKLYNPELTNKTDQENYSYLEGYLPLWLEWARLNPTLIEELREKSQGKVLTDKFANTQVSQARALADILGEVSEPKTETPIPTTPQTPSPIDEARLIVDLLLERDIRLSDDELYYVDELGTLYDRVTKLLGADFESEGRFDPNSKWALPSSTIGTTIDTIVRDFFSEEGLALSYPNVDELSLAEFISLLQTFKRGLESRGETVVPRDITLTGTWAIRNKDGSTSYILVAGTVDLLTYDKEGKFRIYDMKTHRAANFSSDLKKLLKYRKLLSVYKALFNQAYPLAEVAEIAIIPIKVEYDEPFDGTRGSVVYDSYTVTNGRERMVELTYREVETGEEYYVDAAPVLEQLMPLTQADVRIEYDKLTPEERLILRDDLTRIVADVEPPSFNSTDTLVQGLYNNPILSASDRTYLAKQAINNFSYIVSHLQGAVEANEFYFGDLYTDTDFTKMSRIDIMLRVGIGRIFNIVKERYFNPAQRLDIEDFDVLDKLEVAYNNFGALINSAYYKLISLEGITLTGTNIDSASPETSLYLTDESDAGTLEEREIEHWQVGFRQVSARSSLSGLVRGVFEKLKEVDASGNIVKDEYGFDRYVDAGSAVNSILDWTRGADTIEEMEAILTLRAEANGWLNSILQRILEEPFRSLFFQNFRKDFTKYSVTTISRDQEGNRKPEVTIVNTKGATSTLLSNITTSFREGLVPTLITAKKNDIDGKGQVNKPSVTKIEAHRKNLLADLRKAFSRNRSAFTQAVKLNLIPFTQLLNEIGVEISTDILSLALSRDLFTNNFDNTTTNALLSEVGYITNILLDNVDRTDYNPLLKEEENSIYSNYRNIFNRLLRFIPDSVESSTYDDGKLHYSYTVPSYMGSLVNNLKDSLKDPAKFRNYLEENFGSYRWFKDGNTWNNEWLRRLATDKLAREIFDHKALLSYDRTSYTNLSELGYTLSLMSEFFYDRNGKYAWYRLPVLSNKPSSEFLKFIRYSGRDWKESILDGFTKVFNQELLRIKTVIERAGNDNITKISNFDAKGIDAKTLKKILNGKPLTSSEILKIGNKSGARFHFLASLNANLEALDELGRLLVDKINGKAVDEVILDLYVRTALHGYMDAAFRSEIENWEDQGLFETEEFKDKAGKKLERFKYVANLGKTREEIEAKLENYVWNDTFATMNIIQLTTTDLAYYKNAEDFQKRYALVHSPALRLNISAKDENGKLYSRDGKSRTIYIKDYEVKSTLIPNVKTAFQLRLSQITDPVLKREFKLLSDLIVSAFERFSVTDAQGYNSPTSYRKKLGMMGKWNPNDEQAYNRIKEGNYSVNDLGVLWQPLKPFVYSLIRKSSGAEAMSELKVPILNKNSEYLLLLADAIIQGSGLLNKLSAIFDFMERSAAKYDGMGIDTIQFDTAVKVGIQGVLDINNIDSHDEIISYLENAVYDPFDENDPYNDLWVHTIPFEDYGIQQEVPAHLVNHLQLMGSQMRILAISDITPGTEFSVTKNGVIREKLADTDLVNEYLNLIAENIKQSYKDLIDDLLLDGTRKAKTKAISKILVETILKDQRYGADLLRAVSLNEQGEFTIPLSDPIHSTRVQQMLNSIIKSRINKLTIAGGPVVQASVYGVSEDLNIRWLDSKGNLLKTAAEFEESPVKGYKSYEDYLSKNQNSVAYFETYLPIPSTELEELLTKKDGSLYSFDEAVKRGLIPDEMRKAIGYRIPTEDKYSMQPLYIKGFLPKAAGEAIMLPKEITLLSGSD